MRPGHKELLLGLPSGQGTSLLFASRPDEAEHYKRFQVRTCIWFLYVQTECNLSVLFLQLWYSQQAAEGNAPGHPLGFDGYRQFGPIEVVGAGGGGDDLPNIDVIAVGDDAAANGLDDDSTSHFSG